MRSLLIIISIFSMNAMANEKSYPIAKNKHEEIKLSCELRENKKCLKAYVEHYVQGDLRRRKEFDLDSFSQAYKEMEKKVGYLPYYTLFTVIPLSATAFTLAMIIFDSGENTHPLYLIPAFGFDMATIPLRIIATPFAIAADTGRVGYTHSVIFRVAKRVSRFLKGKRPLRSVRVLGKHNWNKVYYGLN